MSGPATSAATGPPGLLDAEPGGARRRVLMVSAQFPYPPRSGFAMRVHHLLRQLSAHHDVTLLAYARPEERAGVAALAGELEIEVETVNRDETPVAAKRRAQLRSLASARPYTCQAVHSAELQRALDALCARRAFDVVQLETTLLCALDVPAGPRLVLDEHNVEYEVLERMHEGERSPTRRSFSRLEAARVRRFERRWWTRVDACAVTSEREQRILEAHAPATPTEVVPNGVDLDAFRPSGEPPVPRTLVFNGILDYRPNLDAAEFLIDDVWPRVLSRCPGARLSIVGRGYAADLERLRRPGVELTGQVPDVRPHLAAASVVGVPVRMGGGTRLKVVEGLAMGQAMVSTTLGCEGVAVRDGEHLLIADDAGAFADRVVELFADTGRAQALGAAGRALMEREYSWDLAGARLEALHRRALARPAA